MSEGDGGTGTGSQVGGESAAGALTTTSGNEILPGAASPDDLPARVRWLEARLAGLERAVVSTAERATKLEEHSSAIAGQQSTAHWLRTFGIWVLLMVLFLVAWFVFASSGGSGG